MGALNDVGFLADNKKLTDAQQLQIINEICSSIRIGSVPTIAGVGLPLQIIATPAAADIFEPNEGLEKHREDFAQWHMINLEIFLESVAVMFDSIPTAGVAAKVIPIVDMTQPIIDVLNELKNLFPDLIDFDVIDFLIDNIFSIFLQIPVFLGKIAILAPDIIAGVSSKIRDAIELFIDFIKEVIVDSFDKSREIIADIKSKIDDLFSSFSLFEILSSPDSLIVKIAEKIRELAQKIISFPELPSLNITLPNFDFSLALPNIDLPVLPIFYSGIPPGIAYFFTEFIKRLVQGVTILLSNVISLIEALLKGISATIEYLVKSIFDITVQILSSLVPDLSKTVTLASTIGVFVKKIVQMAVVSIFGWLVGPGIIINVVAREMGLVT